MAEAEEEGLPRGWAEEGRKPLFSLSWEAEETRNGGCSFRPPQEAPGGAPAAAFLFHFQGFPQGATHLAVPRRGAEPIFQLPQVRRRERQLTDPTVGQAHPYRPGQAVLSVSQGRLHQLETFGRHKRGRKSKTQLGSWPSWGLWSALKGGLSSSRAGPPGKPLPSLGKRKRNLEESRTAHLPFIKTG